MITSRITLLPNTPPTISSEEEQEDILSSSLGVIFPDDITNQHGDAQNSVIYTSPLYGSIILTLADPAAESRTLFSHFVWNAGVELGVLMEDAVDGRREEAGKDEGKKMVEEVNWSVKGERVLEVGAGTGLAGIIAAYAGASEVVISDYPAVEVLANIQNNVTKNIDCRRKVPVQRTYSEQIGQQPQLDINPVSVEGHSWGILNDPFSLINKASFTRILVADCLWMPYHHRNLLLSISHFLSDTPDARAWVIAGFHTGRAKMRDFFGDELLGSEGVGLEIETIFERNAEGNERSWEWERDGGREDVTGRKRWLVVAVLRKRRP